MNVRQSLLPMLLGIALLVATTSQPAAAQSDQKAKALAQKV
ncbi:hypothetical protein [Pontibacter sp. HJ8]